MSKDDKKKLITDQTIRHASMFMIGLIVGIFYFSMYTGFFVFPYMGRDGSTTTNTDTITNTSTNTYTTSTGDPLATFVLIAFEEPPQLFKCGYHVASGSYFLRFEVNIQEVRGYDGTCHLKCEVDTDLNHWETLETFGDIHNVHLDAGQTIYNYEILFSIPQALFDADGLDFGTSSVEIIYD